MRIGLVVDSGCDLPKSFIDANDILILPISIRIGDEVFVDDRDPAHAAAFYQRQPMVNSRNAQTEPFSVEQIKALFLDRVVADYDYAVVQTIASSRSDIHAHASDAANAILRSYKPIREAAGAQGPFALRVIDSQTLFAGQGALAAETVRLIRAGVKISDIRTRIESLAAKAQGYGTFSDLAHVRARARKRGDQSMGRLATTAGRLLDIKPIICGRANRTFPVARQRHFQDAVARILAYTGQRIERGLLAPTLCMSYAGDPRAIAQFPGYQAVAATAQASGVEILTCPMSITGGVNLGRGAFAVGFLAEPEDFE